MLVRHLKHFSSIYFLGILLLGLGLFQSCRKSIDYIQGEVTPYDNSQKVQASIYGQVTDEGGAAVKDALVTTGIYTTTTDANGLFFFKNISTPVHASLVKVKKAGYFNGSRAFPVKVGEIHQAKIVLLAKGTPELFVSNNGGTVNFSGGLSITFPANSIVNAQTGQGYTGQVYVYAKKIDPTTLLGQNSMPGDLRGLTATNQEERLLQSFGMMVAELYDVNGVALQIAAGQKAIMQMKLPSSLLGHAPASIPLWYYDEAKEMWVEEGSASLQGDMYIGQVKHFSFWNCDTPSAAISLEMTLQDQNGNPLSGYTVQLINTANLDQRNGTTNSSGWVGGLVYPNATMTLNVFSNSTLCASVTPIHTQTVTTTNVNQNLGIITVTIPTANTATIDGTILDCLGAPISNATLYIQPYNLMVLPNASGQFSYTLPCTPTIPVTLIAYDLTNNVYGTTTTTLVTGLNNIGSINACGNITPYLEITLTNTVTNISATKTFLAPGSNLLTNVFVDTTTIEVVDQANNSYVSFTHADTTIGTHPLHGVGISGVGSFTDTWYNISTPCTINYTSYPLAPGDLIGTFSVNVIGVPSGNAYTATGSFRIPR